MMKTLKVFFEGGLVLINALGIYKYQPPSMICMLRNGLIAKLTTRQVAQDSIGTSGHFEESMILSSAT